MSEVALVRRIYDVWKALPTHNPLVQCLTNTVVQGFSANVLLAAGASPAMVDVPGEAGDFAAISSATLINLGTIGTSQQLAIPEAAQSAHHSQTPWVLDPVAVGALKVRTRLAHELLNYRPTVIRGNASEIIALCGGAAARGADSTAQVQDAHGSAIELAKKHKTVVAVSGSADFITDGERHYQCANGHAIQTKVTGSGCALGAGIGACVSVTEDTLWGTVAAHAVYGIAAQQAQEVSAGPGTFAANFLDALANVSEDDVERLLAVRQLATDKE
ncbi:hydroxyethylthiazole kinase [Rothia terrae]|uniref:hydroxyethylthiazole kinase n=1 Tax=Rothia terrae TaxID=396015 RepID=UPI00144783D8|nr:hydroxyethylthiazole kinase [Rothia terrae]NKZ34519.1 hydroxyethylthiazole kinase [Rothia terrae]